MDNRKLFAVAHIKGGFPEITHFHARDMKDALVQLFRIRKGALGRVLAYGPSVGAFETEKGKIII